MLNLQNTTTQKLTQVARCHRLCFPNSLATKLGEAYVLKTFGWYLDKPNRFLFHIELNEEVIGYCGGFVPNRFGDGSSSGMLQFAFGRAVKGLFLHPWLLFHKEVLLHYSFLWRNIKQKITGKRIPAGNNNQVPAVFTPYCGLVVIGVHPDYRGQGVAQQLMEEFEVKARHLEQSTLKLSVRKGNDSALKAYGKQGWYIGEEQQVTYVMYKKLENEKHAVSC